jgi:hypothetical protein
VLEELREIVRSAAELTARIGDRFRGGDAAEELLGLLAARVAEIRRLAAGAGLPEECRAEITGLFGRLQVTINEGDGWLAQAGPELASQTLRQRVRRAYGLPPRDD